MYLGFTPLVRRKPSPHGQGTVTYTEFNQMVGENVSPQDAPDPIRQGDTPARQARQPIVLMSTKVTDWNSGFAEDFIPTYGDSHTRIARFQQAGNQAQLNIRAQNAVGVRPNIERSNSAAYGSLFSLSAQTYDESSV